jgi:hypothetical protein
MSFLGAQNSIALGVQGLIHIDTGGGAGGSADYLLAKSLRFRSSASAYLNRTAGTPTAQTKYTISVWVKRGTFAAYSIFSAGSGSAGDYSSFQFNTDTSLAFWVNNGGANGEIITTQLFRDPAAWYHVIVAVDTTQATSSNRMKMYVNGTQVTSFSTATYPSLNGVSAINRSGAVQAIGALYSGSYNQYLDGELAEFNFIDGQQLAPTAFGAYSIYNQWLPIRYAGTYGANGFYLPFTNTTSTSTLVADSSGNANNWTPNNISLTAGSTYDSLTDVPTLTSATVANYAVLNPLDVIAGNTFSLVDGNLSFSATTTAWNALRGSIAVSSGKWYVEGTIKVAASTGNDFGFALTSVTTTANWAVAGAYVIGYNGTPSAFVYNNGVSGGNFPATPATGDVVAIALNLDTGEIWYALNNVWKSGSPSLGTSPSASGLSGTFIPVADVYGASSGWKLNFGQQPFTYTAPSGFLPLNTFNI